MKSIISLASAAMLSLSASAQPVINSNNVSQNFNAELYFTEMPAGFSPGGSGANQTWNFSNIGDGMFLGTQASIPVAGSPHASDFPQANYCYTMDSAFAEVTMYFYHLLTPTAFEIYSLGYMGEVGEDFRQNPRTYVTFPYTYNTVFTDTFKRATDPAPLTVTATYDAYGTLIMPFGTFNNVVRQKTVIDGVTDYAWFNVNPFYPILQTSTADNSLGFIQDNTILGVGDNFSENVITYPNPVASSLNIKLPAALNNVAVSLSDLSGKTLVSGTYTTSNVTLNMESLASGVYFVKISSSTGDIVRKVVKS